MIVKQFFVILAALFTGYVLSTVLHIPIPANVLGLVLLFAALCLKIVKPMNVDKITNFIITYLSVFFVVPTVGIMAYFDVIGHQFVKIIVPILISIICGLYAAGKVTELCIKWTKKSGGERNA